MDPMEKITPDSEEWGYIGKKFLAKKLWAPTAATPFIAAHLKSLMDYPPSQGADTLSMKKAIEEAMKKMDSPKGGNNKSFWDCSTVDNAGRRPKETARKFSWKPENN